MNPRAVRTVVALAAACAFALPLLAALHAWVPGTKHLPLYEPTQSDRLMPFEIGADPSPSRSGAAEIHRTPLVVQDVSALTSHQRILLMVATFRTDPRLLRAELTFAGIPCAYHTADGSEITDNYLLVFERDSECSPSSGQTTGDATLEFQLRNHARIALIGYLSASAPPREALVLKAPGVADARLSAIPVGGTVDVYPANGATRIDLLAYMWNVRPATRWLDAAIAMCGVLLGAAVIVGWPARPASRFTAARQTAAAFFAALALSVSYAVFSPPFQVADEPNHFQVLTDYVGRSDLGALTEEWKRRDRFEEIRFHPSRPFSPLDRGTLGRPSSGMSNPTRDLYGAVRAVWRPLALLGPGMDLPRFFLAARLFHAAAFALTASVFVLLVRSGTGSVAALTAAIPLFLVPTLPQFGMHVSNYAPLLDAYILIGAGAVIASWDGRHSWAAGPILGFGVGAAMSISRSSLPLLPLVAGILAARAVLGDPADRRAAAWAFWGGFTLLLAAMLMFIRPPYADELDLYGALVAPAATAFTVLLRHPVLVLPFGAAGLMSELLLGRLRRALGYRSPPALARGIALGAAIGTFVLFAASLLVPYPELPLYVMPHRPPAREYVRQALLACATFLRFGRPDWATSITFFAGFGWLDTVPAVRLVSMLAGVSGVMLVLLLVWVARARSTRALVWLGFVALGFLASVVAYALSIIRAVPADLHGRYLIGLYLSALVVCWTGLGRTAESSSSGRDRFTSLALAALVCGIAVNVYCLRLILVRYCS